MSIRVRYHPTDLQDEGTIEVLDADSYEVLEDNTVELRRNTRPGKFRVVGHIHSSRWDSVMEERMADREEG